MALEVNVLRDGNEDLMGAVVLLLSIPKWLQHRIHQGYCFIRPGMYGIIKGTTAAGDKLAIEFLHKVWDRKSNGERSGYDNGCNGKGKLGHCAYLLPDNVAFVREDAQFGYEYGAIIKQNTLAAYELKGMTGYEIGLDQAAEIGEDYKWAISPDHQSDYCLPGGMSPVAVTDKTIDMWRNKWIGGPAYQYYIDNTPPYLNRGMITWNDVQAKATANSKPKAAPKPVVLIDEDAYSTKAPDSDRLQYLVDNYSVLLLP